MRLPIVRNLGLLVLTVLVAVVGAAARLDAGVIVTVPAGLSPGDVYRLVFITSTTRDATSTQIQDYNTFVTSVADSVPALSALGASWFAIFSTSSVDAATNIGVSPPTTGIFNLSGVLLASGTADLFDGSILAPVGVDEQGNTYTGGNYPVWTGPPVPFPPCPLCVIAGNRFARV